MVCNKHPNSEVYLVKDTGFYACWDCQMEAKDYENLYINGLISGAEFVDIMAEISRRLYTKDATTVHNKGSIAMLHNKEYLVNLVKQLSYFGLQRLILELGGEFKQRLQHLYEVQPDIFPAVPSDIADLDKAFRDYMYTTRGLDMPKAKSIPYSCQLQSGFTWDDLLKDQEDDSTRNTE